MKTYEITYRATKALKRHVQARNKVDAIAEALQYPGIAVTDFDHVAIEDTAEIILFEGEPVAKSIQPKALPSETCYSFTVKDTFIK